MCGRFTRMHTWREVYEQYRGFLGEPRPPSNLPVSYNVAPSQRSPIVFIRDGQEQVQEARWGLVPSWAKETKIGFKTINARAETVATAPVFRAAFKARRCLVPASGFYEWTGPKSARQPHYITRADGQPMTFAGLWETWHDREADRPLLSFTIITTDANSFMTRLHNRMPMILGREDFGRWLAAEAGQELLRPCPDDWLQEWPVSTHVNKPANDDKSCIEAIRELDQSRLCVAAHATAVISQRRLEIRYYIAALHFVLLFGDDTALVEIFKCVKPRFN